MLTINLDKERHVKFNVTAMNRFKEVTGKDLLKLGENGRLDLSDIVALVWACLVWEDPDLTREQVNDLCEYKDIRQVIRYCLENPT